MHQCIMHFTGQKGFSHIGVRCVSYKACVYLCAFGCVGEFVLLEKHFYHSKPRWADSRLRETEKPQLLALVVGPGWQIIAIPQIRPPGARNPNTGDPFPSAKPDLAKILGIWRTSDMWGCRTFPENYGGAAYGTWGAGLRSQKTDRPPEKGPA